MSALPPTRLGYQTEADDSWSIRTQRSDGNETMAALTFIVLGSFGTAAWGITSFGFEAGVGLGVLTLAMGGIGTAILSYLFPIRLTVKKDRIERRDTVVWRKDITKVLAREVPVVHKRHETRYEVLIFHGQRHSQLRFAPVVGATDSDVAWLAHQLVRWGPQNAEIELQLLPEDHLLLSAPSLESLGFPPDILGATLDVHGLTLRATGLAAALSMVDIQVQVTDTSLTIRDVTMALTDVVGAWVDMPSSSPWMLRVLRDDGEQHSQAMPDQNSGQWLADFINATAARTRQFRDEEQLAREVIEEQAAGLKRRQGKRERE